MTTSQMTKVVAYPRGFLGFDIGLPVETKGGSLDNLLTSVRLNKEIDESRRVISNSKVEAMWIQVINGERFVESFDFRERIILLALHAFGTENFLMWCRLQESSPYLTDMHKRFLNDTFNFIDGGNRSVNIVSWQHLITPRKLTSADAKPDLKTDQFFHISSTYTPSDTSVMSIITKWVGRPDGFHDLLGTLHILFGDPGK